MSRYVAIPFIVALSRGHRDITSFPPIAPKKIPKFAQTSDTVDVFDARSGISGPTSRRNSACPDFHE